MELASATFLWLACLDWSAEIKRFANTELSFSLASWCLSTAVVVIQALVSLDLFSEPCCCTNGTLWVRVSSTAVDAFLTFKIDSARPPLSNIVFRLDLFSRARTAMNSAVALPFLSSVLGMLLSLASARCLFTFADTLIAASTGSIFWLGDGATSALVSLLPRFQAVWILGLSVSFWSFDAWRRQFKVSCRVMPPNFPLVIFSSQQE